VKTAIKAVTARRSVLLAPRATVIQALGVSDRQFSRLENQGVLVPAVKGAGRTPSRYDLPSAVRSYLEYRLRREPGPRDQRELAQAKFITMKWQREQAELLPKAEYVRKGQLLTAALTAKIRAIPNRLVRAGVLLSAREPEALAAVDELLAEIARWRTDQDLVQAANGAGADAR
jgi:hypothetical protein